MDYDYLFSESQEMEENEKIKKKNQDGTSSDHTSKQNTRIFFPLKNSNLDFEAIFKSQPPLDFKKYCQGPPKKSNISKQDPVLNRSILLYFNGSA